MLTIKHDHPGRLWCGPAAIAAITGRPTSTVIAVVRRHRLAGGGGKRTGRGVIGWMLATEVEHALTELGVACALSRRHAGLTLRRYVDDHRTDTCIVLAGRHFVAIEGDLWTDQKIRHAWPMGRPLAEIERPRSRVHSVIEIRT